MPRSALGVPIVAIGGITAANARDAGRAPAPMRGRRDRRRVRRARRRAAATRAIAAIARASTVRADIPALYDEPQRRTLRPRAAHDSRRRQFAGARVPLGRRHAALLRRAARARICGTPTASATSTTSARGARRSSATRIRQSCARCSRRAPRRACRSARRPRSRSRWRRRCAACCRRSSSCGSSRRAPRRRCRRCGSRAASPGAAKIVKFEGCYHGHGDSLLVKAGSGALTFGQPSSAGVPPAIAERDDRAAVQRSRRGRGGVQARRRRASPCIIVEPIAGNMNLDHAAAGFPARAARDLRSLRRGADLRRGDDGLPRASARRAGPLRHHART